MPTGVHQGGNQRAALMRALLACADERGRVKATGYELAQASKLDMHDVVKTAWSLQKQGWLKFQESKQVTGGSQSALSNFVLTDSGLKEGHEMVKVLEVDEATAAEVRAGSTRTVQPTQLALAPKGQGSIDRSLYPNLVAIAEREDLVRKAVDALEAAGLDDLALKAMESGAAYSPIESEILDLFSRGILSLSEEG